MNFVLNAFACLILSLCIIYGLNKTYNKKHECKWVRINENYVGSVFFSVIIFFVISMASLVLLLYIASINYTNNVLLQLKNSGILLAISIAIAGLFTRKSYNIILKLVNKKAIDGLYPLENSDYKWLFVFSCLIMVIVCFASKSSTNGLTIIAILIGKFVWFDIAPEQKNDEIKSLLEVPFLYFIVLYYLSLIVVYTCFLEDLMPGCIAGIALSWIVCLVSYCNKKKTHG